MMDTIKIGICIPFLLYSCYSDLRTRRVSDKVWIFLCLGGTFFITHEAFLYGFPFLLKLGFSVGFIYLLTYILWRIRAFGGADAKCLIVLSFIFPFYPGVRDWNFPIFGIPKHDLFSFSVFGNAVLLTLSLPFFLLLYNLSKNRRIEKYSFIGYRLKTSRIEKGKVKLLQKIEGEKRKLGGIEIDQRIFEKLMSYEEVWVTPKIPFIIPITIGFFCAFFLGDFIYIFVSRFL